MNWPCVTKALAGVAAASASGFDAADKSADDAGPETASSVLAVNAPMVALGEETADLTNGESVGSCDVALGADVGDR